MAALLALEDVRTGYGGGPDIVQGVTLEVEEGRGYCVIGPNGAGKSTLLKVIAGLLPLRSGSIRFRDEDIGRLRPDQRLGRGVCFLPQDPSLFTEMTVHENLMMGGFLENDRSALDGRLERIFGMFPMLAESARRPAGTLSGGQQQTLLIARALMIEPALLLIDEPSLGLAPMVADQIFSVITGLKDWGVTVLMVEQSVVRGLEASDWAFVLDLGVKRFEGPADEMLHDRRIRDLYMGSMAPSGEAEEP